MVSVILLARRHLKWKEELQMNHYRFLEENLHQSLWSCRECHLENFWKNIRNRGKDFANASDYEETWNDSDNITAVIVRKDNFLQHGKQHLHNTIISITTMLENRTLLSYGYKE